MKLEWTDKIEPAQWNVWFMSWTRPRRCFSLYALVVGRMNALFFFFFLSVNPPRAVHLREESSLICYLAVGSKQVHKQKENRFADPARLTKKKSSGSGYVLEIARSPFGIFSSNDKKPSPSEELEESKEVQESKGKGVFFVGGQTGEDCLPYLTDGLKSRVRHWFGGFLRLSLGISTELSFFRKMLS